MALVTKTDLIIRGKYKYSWVAVPGDNPHITGTPDSGRISRTEGYEVIDFMNSYGDKTGLSGLSNAYKLEDMLHSSKSVSRADVIAWIKANWTTWKPVY